MRKLLVGVVMLGMVFALTACGSDDALPSLPGSIVEAPVETITPIDQNFNWSDLFDEEDVEEDNESEFILNNGENEDDGEFAFDFGNDASQGLFPPLEQEPVEMVLEQGIPLEVTNPDLSGLQQQTPVTAVPILESVYEEDAEDELLPLEVTVTSETVIEVGFEEAKELPQTSDPVTLLVVALLVVVIAIILYFLTRKCHV